jgi:hypothetical protein
MTAILFSDRFTINRCISQSSVPSSKLKSLAMQPVELQRCRNDINMVETGACWQLIPKPIPRNSASTSSIPPHGSEFSFTVTIVDPSNGTPFELQTKIYVFPGVPSSIVPLRPIEVKLDQDNKSMHLTVQDAWNNHTAPVPALSDDCWIVQLTDGPLSLVDETEEIKVDGSGQINLWGNLKVSQEYESSTTHAKQTIWLKDKDSQTVLLEASISLKVIPCHVPSKIQVRTNATVFDWALLYN